MKRFLLGDIYRILRDAGVSMSAREIHAALGGASTQVSVSKMLWKLRLRGLVRLRGYGVAARHSVVPGTRCPTNRRGKARGSKKVLASYSRERAEKRKEAMRAPVPQTALEACWGFMPTANFSMLREPENDVVIILRRGKLRPQES